jgi:predicted transposase YbfD/YdcC
VAQVVCIQRDVTEIVTGKSRSETVYGLTSLTPQKASPARLLSLNRNHWSIENRCHWIRDVTFDEDRCQIRTGAGAQVMAGLRNLVLSLLRMAGATNIAEALRYWARQGLQVLRFLGLVVA